MNEHTPEYIAQLWKALPFALDPNLPKDAQGEYQSALEEYHALLTNYQAMKEALEDLIRAAELVTGDITDQDTGWYYQLQGRIQDGLKALTLVNGGKEGCILTGEGYNNETTRSHQ